MKKEAWIFSGCLFLLIGCGPKIMVLPSLLKEVVIGGQSSIQRDTMKVGTPTGDVDLLFVVDNADIAYRTNINQRRVPGLGFAGNNDVSVLSWFSYHYINLINRLLDLRSLTYYSQVITAQQHRMPAEMLKSNQSHESHARHLDELFPIGSCGGVVPNGNRFLNWEVALLNREDVDRRDDTILPRPFSATQTALNSSFSDRGHVPLVIVYILLSDARLNRDEELLELRETLSKANRGKFQTRVLFYSYERSFAQFPGRIQSVLVSLDGQSFILKNINLENLDANPQGINLTQDVLNEVMDLTNGKPLPVAPNAEVYKMILTQRPKRVELLTLRGSNHVFVLGQEYHYDEASNSLIFTAAGRALLRLNDSVEATYYTTVPESPLPGGIGPGIQN